MRSRSDPFKGLARFEDSDVDAALFFGRERDREIVAANLVASRLTVLYGASGVGKSSLLRAGVAHKLRHSPDPSIVVVFDAWQSEPVARLKRALADVAGIEPAPTLVDTLDACATVVGGDAYVLLDQVDEYFLYHRNENGAGTLADELPAALAAPGLRASFLLTLREETLAKLDAFKGRIPNLFGNYLRLEHLDREAGRAAILGPIEYVNRTAPEDERLEIEPALVEEVLDEVAAGRLDLALAGRGRVSGSSTDSRIETPYLQLVMQRLWTAERDAGSRTLRLATLRELGGAEQIVRDRLQGALAALPAGEQDVTAAVFNHLVTPSGTKIAHGARDLAEYAQVDEAELTPVLSRLAAERILRPVADGSGGERYEIFHDVLAEAALAWKRQHDADRELEGERRAAERRHRRLVAALVAAGLLLAVMAGVTVFALTQRSHARSQARLARARELAATAVSQLQVDPQLSLALAVESARLRPTSQSEDVLRQALIASRERAILPSSGAVRTAVFSPDGLLVLTAGADGGARIWRKDGRLLHVLRHKGEVTGAAFSPDGARVLTTGVDGTARIWQASSGAQLATMYHRGPVTSGSFTRDGKVVLTTSKDGTARLWDAATGTPILAVKHGRPVQTAALGDDDRVLATVSSDSSGQTLRVRLFAVPDGRLVRELPVTGVTTVAFNPSGTLLATGSEDHTAAIWQVATGRRLHLFADHQGGVTDVDFGPAGRLLVTTSSDGATRVWDVRTGVRVALILGHVNAVNGASFSTDGRFLVTVSADGTARVWEAATGRLESVLRGHTDSVTAGAFSPDGRAIVTASADGTARVWDPGTASELRMLAAEQKPVWSSSFSPDGNRLVTAGDDGIVRILDAGGRVIRVLRHPGPVAQAVFAPDGATVFTDDPKGTVRVWRARDGKLVRTEPHVAAGPLAFSADGRYVAAPTAAGAIAIRSAATLETLLVLKRGAPFTAASFDPDGRLLATAGADGVARVWDAREGTLLRSLRGHTDALTSVQFSRDGTLLVTAGRDHDARVWDAATGKMRRLLRGHFGPVFGASFSPDGRWVVTAGPVTAGLWQVASGHLLSYLRGPTEPLTAASFSPNGRRIVTASRDGTVRAYTCRLCGGADELLALADARLDALAAPLAADQRDRYLGAGEPS